MKYLQRGSNMVPIMLSLKHSSKLIQLIKHQQYIIYKGTYPARAMTRYIGYTNKPLTGVEIGTAAGLNACSILSNLNIKHLYCIDPYESYTDGDGRYKTRQPVEDKANNRLRRFGNKVTIIKGYSTDVISSIPDNLDFLYIDGNHSYESVKKDLELYYPKVQPGGIIGGHDFTTKFLGVSKAIVEFTQKNQLQLQGEDIDWWCIK